jgi:hypothetical protein
MTRDETEWPRKTEGTRPRNEMTRLALTKTRDLQRSVSKNTGTFKAKVVNPPRGIPRAGLGWHGEALGCTVGVSLPRVFGSQPEGRCVARREAGGTVSWAGGLRALAPNGFFQASEISGTPQVHEKVRKKHRCDARFVLQSVHESANPGFSGKKCDCLLQDRISPWLFPWIFHLPVASCTLRML